MKIAITGANGFLGSRISIAAIKSGHEVIALVRKGANLRNLPTNNKLHIQEVNYQADHSGIRDLNLITSKYGVVDLFIHNAGLTVSLSKSNYFEVNHGLSRQIIDSIRDNHMLASNGKLIYISSYAANGPAFVNEPVSDYGSSKRATETYLTKSDINSLIIRPTAIYGPGDKAFLPLFKTASLGIYPMLAPKEQKISMIHADDLAKIILRQYNTKHQVIHCSDGKVYTHEDLRMALEKTLNRKIKKVRLPKIITKSYLAISDLFFRQMDQTPHLTLEKYEEISCDWNLSDDDKLKHIQPEDGIKLNDGFLDTWNYYKTNNFV